MTDVADSEAQEIPFSDFQGKKVVLIQRTTKEDGSPAATEHEGTVELVNEDAKILMFKPKGRTLATLLSFAQVEEVREVEQRPKKLRAQTLKPLAKEDARKHLIERHGFKVSEIEVLSDQQAFDYHEQVDHSDLGHVHRDKNTDPEATEDGDSTSE